MLNFLFFLILRFYAQDTAILSVDTDVNRLQKHVNYLCSDALDGRLTGSIGEAYAAQYIAGILNILGLEPAGDNGSYIQKFDFIPNSASGLKRTGKNVLALLRLGPNNNEKIVLSAHFDHLGHGESTGSLAHEDEKGSIHYGADDNASGVAILLEGARILSRLKAENKLQSNRDILFAFWSGEELGLLGSTHFINQYQKKTTNTQFHAQIIANINLDMVGHLNKHLTLLGVGSSSIWPGIIREAQKQAPISALFKKDPYLPTDSTAFYLRQIPVISFFTGVYSSYHSPRDTPDTLNYQGMTHITQFLVALVSELTHLSNAIEYQAVPAGKSSVTGFKVYLGTVPDYASSDVLGVKIAGVTVGSPAALAGIKAGDILLSLAGKKINNIYDYSNILTHIQANKAIQLSLRRGQKQLTLTIMAKSRV